MKTQSGRLFFETGVEREWGLGQCDGGGGRRQIVLEREVALLLPLLLPSLVAETSVLSFHLSQVNDRRRRWTLVHRVAAAELAEQGIGTLVDAVVTADERCVRYSTLPRLPSEINIITRSFYHHWIDCNAAALNWFGGTTFLWVSDYHRG